MIISFFFIIFWDTLKGFWICIWFDDYHIILDLGCSQWTSPLAMKYLVGYWRGVLILLTKVLRILPNILGRRFY